MRTLLQPVYSKPTCKLNLAQLSQERLFKIYQGKRTFRNRDSGFMPNLCRYLYGALVCQSEKKSTYTLLCIEQTSECGHVGDMTLKSNYPLCVTARGQRSSWAEAGCTAASPGAAEQPKDGSAERAAAS